MGSEHAGQIRDLVSASREALLALSDEHVDSSRGEGAWTRRQILGHLIDSTAANHQRFVRAQYEDELRFPAYDAPGWVVTERWDIASWRLLVEAWTSYALLLAHILDVMPQAQLETPVWVDWYGEPTAIPLNAVAEAYVDHVRHHLAQLLG